jgi:hypothetical protein
MKTHRRILHVVIPARTVPVEGLTGAVEADPLIRAARGILILAVILGSLGTDAMVSSGYGSAGHTSAHQQAASIRLAASAHPIGPGHSGNSPWMY